jgi:integrase
MATFVTVKKKNGTACQAIIRKVGHKPIKKTFSTKGEAKHWASEQESLIYRKRYNDPRLAEAVNLKDALEKYANHSRDILKKSPTTLEREVITKNHLLNLLGTDTPLSEITAAIVYSYQKKRIAEGASASAIRQELSMLSRMFRIARGSWQLNIDNPVATIDRVPPAPGKERFLTRAEAEIVLSESKKVRNKKFYTYVLLLMHTGMRSAEAARIKISDIDLDRQIVTIWKTKSARPRTIPLTDEVIVAIRELSLEEDGYLFLSAGNRASAKQMLQPGKIFRRSWETAMRRIYKAHPSFAPFTPHDIRHTAASHLLMQGVDTRIIADILGHSTLSMIMRYTHLFDETKRIHINKIAYLGSKDDAGKE